MIEKTILDYMSAELTEPVALERDGLNGRFLLIQKTGSSKNNFIDRATFAFQSYDASLYNAAEFNEKVKTAVFSLIAHDDIYSVKLVSDYNFTDPTTKEYRYQAIFDIYY